MSEVSAGDLNERFLFRKMDMEAAARSVPVTSGGLVSQMPRQGWLAQLSRKTMLLPAPAVMMARAPIALRSAAALEVERGTLFLLVPVFLAAGAFAYFSLPVEPGFLLLVACLLTTIAAVAFLPRGRIPQLMALAVMLTFCGVLLAKGETWRMSTKMLGGDISTRITGRVVSIEPLSNGRARLTIDLMTTERPKLRYAPGRIRATARKAPLGIEAGSIVSGLVRLRPPSGPVRPDSYDFSFESYFDGIGASGYFMKGPDLVAQPGPGFAASVGTFIENARNDIAARIRQRIGGAEGEIAAALVVGVRAGIPNDVSEALRRTGLYHIISISGLHMALVAGVVIGALRAGFALFPGISSAPAGPQICGACRLDRHCRLPRHLRRRGRGAAQLPHACRHADRAGLRPGGADHAQPGNFGHHRAGDHATRGDRPELPDVGSRRRQHLSGPMPSGRNDAAVPDHFIPGEALFRLPRGTSARLSSGCC